LRRALSPLPPLYPTDETWAPMDRWVERAAKRASGSRVGDLLIGALAAESGSLVWSLDADFDRMKRLGLVDVYEP